VGIVCPPPPQPKPPPGTPEQAGAALPASACDLPLVERIKAMPGVASVTRGGTDDLFADTLGSASVTRPGQSAHLGETHRVAVETDFLQTMDARLLAGRLFDSSSAYDRQLLSQRIGFDTAQADTVPVVVTRAFLPMVGVLDPQEAIGQQFAMPAYARGVRAFEVVGVVEDWHRRTLRHAIDPIVFTPGGWTMQIIVKTTPEAQLTVRNAIRDINPPGRPPAPGTPFIRKLVMLDDDFTSSFREDQRLMAAVAGFAAFAMGVAALGVFALSAFEIRRRVREIGIRKALGAGPAKMAGMVLGQSLLSAAIASLLAWPIAWWAAGAWLSSFVYRTELAPALLPVASLFVITFVALAVSFNAARAAAVRPNIALRTTG
jgi:putative ABC transport system permease protein